jgi:hypothetical protein
LPTSSALSRSCHSHERRPFSSTPRICELGYELGLQYAQAKMDTHPTTADAQRRKLKTRRWPLGDLIGSVLKRRPP